VRVYADNEGDIARAPILLSTYIVLQLGPCRSHVRSGHY